MVHVVLSKQQAVAITLFVTGAITIAALAIALFVA
jgi:hypothetical protein